MQLDEGGRSRLYCVSLDPAVEDVLGGYIDRGPAGTTVNVPPALANRLAAAVSRSGETLAAAGHPVIVLTSPAVRAAVKQILDSRVSGVTVLSYNEVVDGLDVESMGLVQFEEEPANESMNVGAA